MIDFVSSWSSQVLELINLEYTFNEDLNLWTKEIILISLNKASDANQQEVRRNLIAALMKSGHIKNIGVLILIPLVSTEPWHEIRSFLSMSSEDSEQTVIYTCT